MYILKFMEFQGTLNDKKIIQKKKKNIGSLKFLGFKTFQKAAAIIMCCWHKDRHVEQRNRIESPEIHIHIHSQIILGILSQSLDGEKTAFSTKDGETGYKPVKEKKPDPYFT